MLPEVNLANLFLWVGAELIGWGFGVPFLIWAEVKAAEIIEKKTGRYSAQKATLEMLRKLAKKPGYKRVAKQAIQAVVETTEEVKEKGAV
jgi:hypothetical protein